MDAKIAGFIEELHYDEEGKRVIDKFKITHLSLVSDKDGNFIMPPFTHIRGPGVGEEIEVCDPEFRLLIEDEVVDALKFSGSDESAKNNTDVEIWRKVPDDYYSPSIHVTEQGDIGINVGGYVLVSPIERWFAAGEAANRRGCLIEDDHIVQMPPVREYTARARIKSIEKATPHIVGLDIGLEDWDKLSDEALLEFEGLVKESESGGPPSLETVDPNLVDYMEYPAYRRRLTLDDRVDWLMEK